MNTAMQPDAGLAEVLVARARAASDGRLVADVIVGMLVAIGIAVWHPSAWLIVFGAGVALASFGGWGIADRELAERANTPGAPTALLALARGVAAIAGGVGTALAAFGTLAFALGTWIS